MALMEWSENYSVKVNALDNQHKRIVSLINELHSAMRQAQGKEVLGKILEELTDYTIFHFSAEEKLMKDNNYPGYINHKAEHDKLTKQVKELTANFKSGKNLVSQEVLQLLKDWLLNHIAGSDKKYSSFFNNVGIA